MEALASLLPVLIGSSLSLFGLERFLC
jgi:hypothetical protein